MKKSITYLLLFWWLNIPGLPAQSLDPRTPEHSAFKTKKAKKGREEPKQSFKKKTEQKEASWFKNLFTRKRKDSFSSRQQASTGKTDRTFSTKHKTEKRGVLKSPFNFKRKKKKEINPDDAFSKKVNSKQPSGDDAFSKKVKRGKKNRNEMGDAFSVKTREKNRDPEEDAFTGKEKRRERKTFKGEKRRLFFSGLKKKQKKEKKDGDSFSISPRKKKKEKNKRKRKRAEKGLFEKGVVP